VAITPTRLEADAATMAPATLPRPMEVNATEDCTVEGTRVRNKMPRDISSVINNVSGSSVSTKMGKSKKVDIKIVMSRVHCTMHMIASCENNHAQNITKNTEMAKLTRVKNTSANCPRAGKIMAMMTAEIIKTISGSTFFKRSSMSVSLRSALAWGEN